VEGYWGEGDQLQKSTLRTTSWATINNLLSEFPVAFEKDMAKSVRYDEMKRKEFFIVMVLESSQQVTQTFFNYKRVSPCEGATVESTVAYDDSSACYPSS